MTRVRCQFIYYLRKIKPAGEDKTTYKNKRGEALSRKGDSLLRKLTRNITQRVTTRDRFSTLEKLEGASKRDIYETTVYKIM